MSNEQRMKITGHSSKAINHRYTHLEVATLRTAVTAMPLFSKKWEVMESARSSFGFSANLGG